MLVDHWPDYWFSTMEVMDSDFVVPPTFVWFTKPRYRVKAIYRKVGE